MKINTETIFKVADLARIEIKETEVEGLKDEMSKILTFMEKLNELDTASVEPLVYMNAEVNVWRADQVKKDLTVAEGLSNASLHTDQFFMVPKIIEK